MVPFEPGPDARPPSPPPPTYFESDQFGLLLGVVGSVLLVVGVWLLEKGYTFDAVAAFSLAALGITIGALTFRRRRGAARP